MTPDSALLLPEVIKECRRSLRTSKLSDSTGANLTGGEVLARALALRRVLNRHYLATNETYVGVIMPPTVAGAVVNLALALDKRIPVNLNFVLGADRLQHSIDQAGIQHVLTSRKVLDRLELSYNATSVILEDLPALVTTKDKAVAAALGMAMPSSMLIRHLGLHETDPEETFALLFTSGSTGEPKGVMLSHTNIASNCHAIAEKIGIREKDVLLGLLPFFHAFGLTVTLWMPLLSSAAVAYHTNPLEPDEIGKLARNQKATILLSTPTLLNIYESQIPATDLETVNMIATGAEHLSPSLADRVEAKYGIRPFEGYGATETSPAIAFNVPPDRWHGEGPAPIRSGTVGTPIPGIEIKVLERESGSQIENGRQGALLVKGPGVMKGYLNRPDLTAQVIDDGWYNTRDIVRIDEDGFITITGRESQFSKIGGEMVPHLLIQDAIADLIQVANQSEASVGVAAVPHKQRGERVVVLHTIPDLDASELTGKLRDSGLPPLWIPNADSFVEVPDLPILGTGKLDLPQLNVLAQTFFDPDGSRVAQEMSS